jgi:hypothetical protein
MAYSIYRNSITGKEYNPLLWGEAYHRQFELENGTLNRSAMKRAIQYKYSKRLFPKMDDINNTQNIHNYRENIENYKASDAVQVATLLELLNELPEYDPNFCDKLENDASKEAKRYIDLKLALITIYANTENRRFPEHVVRMSRELLQKCYRMTDDDINMFVNLKRGTFRAHPHHFEITPMNLSGGKSRRKHRKTKRSRKHRKSRRI